MVIAPPTRLHTYTAGVIVFISLRLLLWDCVPLTVQDLYEITGYPLFDWDIHKCHYIP